MPFNEIKSGKCKGFYRKVKPKKRIKKRVPNKRLLDSIKTVRQADQARDAIIQRISQATNPETLRRLEDTIKRIEAIEKKLRDKPVETRIKKLEARRTQSREALREAERRAEEGQKILEREQKLLEEQLEKEARQKARATVKRATAKPKVEFEDPAIAEAKEAFERQQARAKRLRETPEEKIQMGEPTFKKESPEEKEEREAEEAFLRANPQLRPPSPPSELQLSSEIDPFSISGLGMFGLTSEMKEKGMSNFEIDDVIGHLPGVKRTIANDEISEVKLNPGITAFVYNTDPKNLPGRHWCCIYIDRKNEKEINVYNPFGDQEENQETVMKQLKWLTKNEPTLLKVKINAMQNQRLGPDSSNCGWFCCKFIIDRIVGRKSFKEATGFKEPANKNNSPEMEEKAEKLKAKFKNFEYM